MSSSEHDSGQDRHRQGLSRLRDLCAGDGERLDLLEAGLALSTLHAEERLDLVPFRQHVAAMADEVADLVRRRGAQPEALADVIARAYAYRGDSETYDDLQNADLVRVIERRKGLPVALSILYLHVARAQAWQAEGLAFPGHFLIRIGIDGARHVVDPFHDGSVRDAAELRGLVKRENWTETARSLERMLAIAPDRPDLLFEAGQVNARLDKRRAAIAAYERLLALDDALADPELRHRTETLLQELRRGLN